MKTYLIVGLGRFGTAVALKLQDLGNEVMVIDENEEQVQKLSDKVTYAVVGDARDESVLESLGVRNLDCAIVAIGQDLAASVVITLNLKSLGVPNVICKAQDDLQKRALEKLGADRVLIPEREMGLKLAQNLTSSSVLDYVELSKDCGLAEILTPKPWAGKTLMELDVRKKFGVTVAGLRKSDGDLTVFVDVNYRLKADDELLLVGNNEDLARVQML